MSIDNDDQIISPSTADLFSDAELKISVPSNTEDRNAFYDRLDNIISPILHDASEVPHDTIHEG